MFKKIRFMLLALAVVFALVVPQAFALNHFIIYVYKDIGFTTAAGGYTPITSGIQYAVFDYDADPMELETIYGDANATAMTNPIISSVFNLYDRIDFYTADADTIVDILITDENGGYTLFLQDVTTNTRTAIINERPNERHLGTILYTTMCSGETVSENGTVASGVTLLNGTLIEDVYLEVIRASGCDVAISFSISSTLDTFLAQGSLTGELVPAASAAQMTGRDLSMSTACTSTFYGTGFWPIYGSITGETFSIDHGATCLYFWTNPAANNSFIIRGDQCLGYKVNCTSATATTEVYFGSAGTAQGWGLFHFIFMRPR